MSARLLNEGTHYFLSRPRRFGKSLLLDTLKDLFEGNEPPFAGLDIHDWWDWSVRHPVVGLSFGSGNFKEPGQVEARLTEQLAAIERRAGLAADYATVPGRFGDLLEALHRKTGQPVVVLVDEYDKPILDALDVPDVARANRDFSALGLDVAAEDAGSSGRLDMVLRFNANVYLFEFKVVESTPSGAAMAQLKDRRYADKYRSRGEPIHLIAVEFSSKARNLASFSVERA